MEPAEPATADSTTAPAPPATAAPATAVPAAPGGGRSPRDMALSLVVLLVPIVLLLVFYRVLLDGEKPVVVDPRPAVAQARAAALFPVAEPVGLDADWRVSAADFRRADGGATLRIGYVGPGDDPVQLVQSSVAVGTLLPAELGATAAPRGTAQVGDRTWQRYDARPGESALVLLDSRRTVVVIGSTDERQLLTLAGALR